MKTNGHKAAQLQGGNLAYYEALLKTAKLERSDFGLWLLVADMLDEVTTGVAINMYIGHTKNRSAFAVYVNRDEEVPGLYATSLPDLSRLAVDLL